MLINKTKGTKSYPNIFQDGDQFITNKYKIAERFNTYFTNIGPELANKISVPPNKIFTHYLVKQINSNFTFKSVNEIIVNKVIDDLNSKSSFGKDEISSKLIKLI